MLDMYVHKFSNADAYEMRLLMTGSEKNASALTLDGVDVMGERLASEVSISGFPSPI